MGLLMHVEVDKKTHQPRHKDVPLTRNGDTMNPVPAFFMTTIRWQSLSALVVGLAISLHDCQLTGSENRESWDAPCFCDVIILHCGS
jgi:hypothetical protein